MATLDQLETRVRDRMAAHLSDTFLTDARVDAQINVALQQICSEHDWPWLQAEPPATITTVAGTASYAVPADYLRTVALTSATTGETLSRRPLREIRRTINQGTPSVFTIYGNKVHLRAIPSGVFTITHDYIKIEPALANGSDVALIPDLYNEGVVEFSAYLLFRATREETKAQEALTAYKAWVARTQDNINQSLSTIRISVRPGSEF